MKKPGLNVSRGTAWDTLMQRAHTGPSRDGQVTPEYTDQDNTNVFFFFRSTSAQKWVTDMDVVHRGHRTDEVGVRASPQE